MEIVNKNCAFLSNYEVYKLLKETKEKQESKSTTNKKQQLKASAILNDSLSYLEKTACVQQNKDIIKDFKFLNRQMRKNDLVCHFF